MSLTVENFIQTFRDRHGWLCEPNTRITNDLTSFAKERIGSKRNKDELYVMFCVSKGLKPFPPLGENGQSTQTAQEGGE